MIISWQRRKHLKASTDIVIKDEPRFGQPAHSQDSEGQMVEYIATVAQEVS